MRLTTITVELELGPQTRALFERGVVAGPLRLELELGPMTRENLGAIAASGREPGRGPTAKLGAALRSLWS
jgi:hypothetical protein